MMKSMGWTSGLFSGQAPSKENGFSLVETMVGAAILGLTGVALCGGMTMAATLAKLNTENLRATQILTEKMDLIRACEWSQITNGYGFIPNTFTTPFFSSGTNTNSLMFQGTVSIVNAPVTESYGKNLRQITVGVTWVSANVTRSRSMTTFVSPYGIGNYSH